MLYVICRTSFSSCIFFIEHVFASLPQMERGVAKVIGGDPKGNNFLYTNGKCVIIRNIEVCLSFLKALFNKYCMLVYFIWQIWLLLWPFLPKSMMKTFKNIQCYWILIMIFIKSKMTLTWKGSLLGHSVVAKIIWKWMLWFKWYSTLSANTVLLNWFHTGHTIGTTSVK